MLKSSCQQPTSFTYLYCILSNNPFEYNGNIFNPFGFIFSYATSVQILASSLSPLHDITFISVSVENKKSLGNLMILSVQKPL